MKYTSESASAVAHGPHAFSAGDDGVIDIPDDQLAPFLDLVASGVLVPVVDQAQPDLAELAKAVESAQAALAKAQAKYDRTKPDSAARQSAGVALAAAQMTLAAAQDDYAAALEQVQA